MVLPKQKVKNKGIVLYHAAALGILLTVILGLYANTFDSPFIFDDAQNIERNYLVKIDELSLDGLHEAATSGPNKWRMLPNISFALNFYFGGDTVRGYHLVNIFIHIAAAFTFYLLARLTLDILPSTSSLGRSHEIALAAALLWAVHPLQTNGVTYIVQRMTSLAALFSLLSLLFYVKGRVTANIGAKVLLWAGSLVFVVMALFSKENSGMLPVVIVGYEVFVLDQLNTRKQDTKKYLLMAGGALLAFALICWLFVGSEPLTRILGGYSGREFTPGQRLLTESRIIFHYLSLLVLPLHSRLNLAYDFQLSTGLLAPPQTLLSVFGVTGLAGLAFFLYRRDRLAGFAVFWFLASLLIESSIIPLELIFEHRMYLPSLFLILAGAAWGYRLLARKIMFIRTLVLVICALLCIATVQRNSVWSNEISLWKDVTRKAPDNLRGLGNLGLAYLNAGKYDLAEDHLRKAIEVGLADRSGNFSLQAKKQYLAIAHDNLGIVYRAQKRYPEAISHASKALELDPTRKTPLITLGIIFTQLQEYRTASRYFEQAARKGVYTVDLLNNWAISAYNLNNADQAITLLKQAIELDPLHPESHYNLGIAYSSKGMPEEAQREMALAMKLRNRK